MRFLVTRMDALEDGRRRNQINSSMMWPTVVNADTHEDAVAVVYAQHFGPEQRLPIGREFLVVALIDAQTVVYKPRQEYTIHSKPYEG